MEDFEKLGVFYLGREYDLAAKKPQKDLLLYDSKDLTTHAVCVGMTGSGKTGLCMALLEEAAIDGVPAIAIDPKGDIANLLLAFPELRPVDFRPWVDPGQATREGITPDELAARTAEKWKAGLAEWGQDGARVAKYRDSVDMAIYTPGGDAGLPLAVLGSLSAPGAAVINDAEALRQRVGSLVSSLLTLAGIEADPIRSREHILLSQIVESAWRGGQNLDLGSLVHGVQSPPLERVGAVDLETFFPARQRQELSIRLNILLASPGFAAWTRGEPLDVARLLHTPQGKPRLSILSIAHLSDQERMFFVTLLLSEVLAWARSQSGTSSLRAILYMDEVFGYFPPTANPPSKTPMLTLLKQARAFGLGVVLATQNPVDLDYKGLSNAGTWLLGRLQTERDKARVLEGLEGASTASGATFDRGRMEATLAALGSRVFLMNNVHEDHPIVFESRWCLSYLSGPLAREQIRSLMAARKAAESAPESDPAATNAPGQTAAATAGRPLVPPEAGECFLQRPATAPPGPLTYVPGLLGCARLHYVDAKASIDQWQEIALLARADGEDEPWAEADTLEGTPQVDNRPAEGATFAPLPAALARAKNYVHWQKSLASHLYREQALALFRAHDSKQYSRPGESEGEFRVRLQHLAREQRDAAVEQLRGKYSSKAAALDDKILRAVQRLDREKSQFQSQLVQTVISVGSSILKALTGRKLASRTSVTGLGTAARSAGRSVQQHGDIGRADESVEVLKQRKADLESQLKLEIEQLDAAAQNVPLEAYPVRPRKTDIAIQKVVLAWIAQ